MRVVIVGLGTQGRKRLAVAGDDVVATVDPVVAGVTTTSIDRVPLDQFDAALVCTPEDVKVPLLKHLLAAGKHVLVEKPLLAAAGELLDIETLSARTGAIVYTAYNHRFEPQVLAMKELLDQRTVGEVYHARLYYGNGTARDVRASEWRDRGLGVAGDLASHLLDLTEFLFGRMPVAGARLWVAERFENRANDYVVLGFPGASPLVTLEASLLSWRNHFAIDVIGAEGSLHLQGLCKWGPSSLTIRTRKLPSGRPDERISVIEQADDTWSREYAYFQGLCRRGTALGLDRDRWIDAVLTQVFTGLPTTVPA